MHSYDYNAFYNVLKCAIKLSASQPNLQQENKNRQVALLWQRDRATRLSVEILQLQNISIVWHYLRDPTFSRFYTIQSVTDTHIETDGQIHDDGMYCVSIASRGKNRPYCTRPTKYNYYAGNERWLIAKSTVIITYLNDNAQTPLNRLAVYMLYSQLCNTYGDKSNRWSVGLI